MRKLLNKVLENVSTIAIGGHIRPDGDCVGSCVGLGQYIRENYSDKTVDIYLKDIPESFHFLNGTETILESVDNEEKIYDLFISLDCGDTDRLEYSKPLFVKAKHTFCVDHHISNIGFAEVNHIVPEASSTSELVYGLLDEEKISKDVAEALYLGIVHDTGVFQYSCAGPETFRVAAKLLEKGIDAPKIILCEILRTESCNGACIDGKYPVSEWNRYCIFYPKRCDGVLRGRAERSGRNCKPAPCNGRGRSCRVYV